ncbi:MAG: methionyl-tRNA formyltransferase [Candidatus Kapaibacteriota bacterium]
MTKIVFFGTPEIAVPVLVEINKLYQVVAVVTNTDKEQGRGRKIQPSEIKVAAEKLNLKLLQPEDLKSEEFENELRQLDSDIFLVFAYKILPAKLLSIPKYGSFNIHPSLLPKYRGAAPINHTIINGDKETGITTFLMEEKIDAGGILLQEKFTLEDDLTAGDLQNIVMQKAPQIAIETIEKLISGDKSVIPQDPSLVSKAPKIFRENCELNFNNPATKIKNFINGVSPNPGAWKIWNGKNIKFLRAKLAESSMHLEPAKYLITQKKMFIGCADGAIEILEIQPEGKKYMKIIDFINGFKGENEGLII